MLDALLSCCLLFCTLQSEQGGLSLPRHDCSEGLRGFVFLILPVEAAFILSRWFEVTHWYALFLHPALCNLSVATGHTILFYSRSPTKYQ